MRGRAVKVWGGGGEGRGNECGWRKRKGGGEEWQRYETIEYMQRNKGSERQTSERWRIVSVCCVCG